MITQTRFRSLSCSTIIIIGLVALLEKESNAFQAMHSMPTPGWRRVDGTRIGRNTQDRSISANCNSIIFASPPETDSDSVQRLFDYNRKNFDNEIDEDDMEEIELGQPPEWMVMQQLLGINIFTVILAGSIVFLLGMNFVLGPGWLGSKIGIPGTGFIQEVSPSLPGSIDLNKPEYRL